MRQTREWRFVLASTGIGSFVTSANLSTVNVAFPDMKESFPAQPLSGFSWVITAYTIAFAAVLLPAGRVADTYGRRRLFFSGLALFAVGSLIAGAAPEFMVLVLGRAVQGAGGALIVPASLGLLLQASRPEDLTRSVALYGGITALGVATGPTLGALIVDSVGWRWSFLLSPPFALSAWLLGRRDLSRTQGDGRQRIDGFGVLAVAVAMALLTLGIAEGGQWGWASWPTLGSLGLALLASRYFVLRCRAHLTPVLPLELFRIRSFSLSTGATVLFGAGTGAVLLTNVLFLTGPWGYSIVTAGLAMSPSPVVAAIAAPFVGRFGARFGERTVGVPGALILAGAVLWFWSQVENEPSYWADWFPGAVLSGLGINMVFPMLQSAGVRDVGPARFSVANASTRASLQVGTGIGIALLVAILGNGDTTIDDFRNAWLMIAGFAAATALVVVPLRPRQGAIVAMAEPQRVDPR